jgi:hydrogenase maturation protease
MGPHSPAVLVAGIGNVLCGDDGFGVEVVRRLAERGGLPPWVHVIDYGVRGLHLAFDMLERQYDVTILVDATTRGGRPGTVYVIDPGPIEDIETGGDEPPGAELPGEHGMSPDLVLSLLRSLGGTRGRVFIVGCEPAAVEEGTGLSGEVQGAVDQAIALISEVCGATPVSSLGRS